MKLRTRLQRLERRAAALPASRPPEESPDDEFAVWCRGGCLGPLPPAGPRPAKYRSNEEWQQEHRFLVALCCREVGQPDPPWMTEAESLEVDDAVALFASLDPNGAFTLRQQAELAPYVGVIQQFLSDPGGGVVPLAYRRGESP